MVHRVALASVLLLASAAAREPPRSALRREAMASVARNLAFMDEALRRTAEVGDDAREEKDIAKLVCVDEKLHAMRHLASIGKEANAELLSSSGGDDVPVVAANAARIAIARERMETLANQAERCMGALLHRTGETTNVEVREPAGLPGAGSEPSRLGVVHRLERPEDRSPMVNPDAAFDAIPAER